MCTKKTQIGNPLQNENYPQEKLWIMWITRCISGFLRKNGDYSGGQVSTKLLWIIVDKVDKKKIEHNFCAICLVYHKICPFGRFKRSFPCKMGNSSC